MDTRVNADTDLRPWPPDDRDPLIDHEPVHPPAPGEHAEDDTVAEEEPGWYPPPGEPCM